MFQLQQEKKKLQEDYSSLLQDRETLERRCATIQREQTQLGPRLEETKWEVGQEVKAAKFVFFYFFGINRIHFSAVCSPQVCQKSGEISLLKQQLKEIQSELSQKAGDIVVLKAQLREARSELQASQARSQEAQTCLRTRSLELEVCENELQRRKSEAELLREKVGRLEEESVRLRDTASNQSGHSLPGNAFVKGHCMNPTLPHVRGVAGRGGPSPSVYRDAEEQYVMWGGESDEAKAQRQNTETVLSLRQQVLFFVAQKKTHSSYSIYSVFKYFISS